MEVFLSKDLSLLERHKDIFELPSKYLDGEDINGNRITYLTFPRCGSTFLRNYIEKITGIATGSTMFHELAYHHTLFDFKGEGITDNTVWVSKTHYPSPVYGAKVSSFNKVLCCVR